MLLQPAEPPAKGAVLVGRPPKEPDAAPRVRRADDHIPASRPPPPAWECPLGERPRKDIQRFAPEGRSSQAGEKKRKQMPEPGQISHSKAKQRGSFLTGSTHGTEKELEHALTEQLIHA